MRKRTGLWMACLVLAILAAVACFTYHRIAHSHRDEQDYRTRLESVCSDKIVDFIYDDFDADGTNEAFATSTKDAFDTGSDCITADVWYITDTDVKKLYADLRASVVEAEKCSVIVKLDSKGKKLVAVSEWYQTGNSAYIWYVQDGEAVLDAGTSGKGICFIKNNEEYGWIEGCSSAYDNLTDNTGHTWKTYYFYFDDGLKEYGGIPVSEDDVKGIRGGKGILQSIREKGKIQSIFARENGIIQINYLAENVNCNATLLYRNQSLEILAYHDADADALENSNQGGVYTAAMIASIATYPDKIEQYVNDSN